MGSSLNFLSLSYVSNKDFKLGGLYWLRRYIELSNEKVTIWKFRMNGHPTPNLVFEAFKNLSSVGAILQSFVWMHCLWTLTWHTFHCC